LHHLQEVCARVGGGGGWEAACARNTKNHIT
jgi:hypothetical protein